MGVSVLPLVGAVLAVGVALAVGAGVALAVGLGVGFIETTVTPLLH